MKQDILTARAVAEIQRQKKWGWHHDGGGLYLVGSETYGTFSWTLRIYRNTVTGRPRDLGLGSAKILGLKQARRRALEIRRLALEGVDPIEEKRRKRDEARDEARKTITFNGRQRN